jgi:hypothetical protein
MEQAACDTYQEQKLARWLLSSFWARLVIKLGET